MLPHWPTHFLFFLPAVHLVPHMASDTTALNLFANAINEDSQKKFMASIWPKITAGWAAAPHESLQPKWFRLFVDQCSVRVASIPKPLAIANSVRKAKYNRTRNTKKCFGQRLGFTHHVRKSKSAQFANIAETTVTAYSHDEAYPPLKHWMYESDKIMKKWKKQLTSGRRPDTCKPYLPRLKVDPNLLEHDIPPPREPQISRHQREPRRRRLQALLPQRSRPPHNR